MEHKKFPWPIFFLILFLLGVHLYLSLTNPMTAAAQKLGLGRDLVRLALSASLVVPIFLSLFFGMWSSTLLFRNEKFKFFAVGILVITLGTTSGIMLSVIRNHYFFNQPEGLYKFFTIIINYLYTFAYLTGFYLLILGTRKLLPNGIKRSNILISIFVALLLGTFYSVVLLTNPDRTVSMTPGVYPSHYLNDFFILLTIILPTFIAWFLATAVGFTLADVYSFTESSDHRSGFKTFLYGVIMIIFAGVMLQAIFSIGTTRFVTSGLKFILIILYIFVFVLVVGYFQVLRGAQKLTEI